MALYSEEVFVMRVGSFLFSIFIIVFSASPSWADTCTGWNPIANKAALKSCTYTSGGSGYTVLKNITGERAEVCYRVMFTDGGDFKGCRTLDPGQEASTSCSQCANGGADNWELLKFNVEN